MYGRAEAVTGRLLAEAGLRQRAFVATKVWTSGRAAGLAQMQASLRQLGGERIDLMQIHNLLDWRTHLPVLREWQAAGRIRYVGISHYTASAYDEVEAVLRAERLDFLQINYALDDRQAAQRLLPLAPTVAWRCWSTGRLAAAAYCAAWPAGPCRPGRPTSAQPAGRKCC